MSDVTKIEWTNHTWGPWEGCTKVSLGCQFCYAESRNHRFGMDNWGRGKPRRRTVDWRSPLNWNRKAGLSGKHPRIFPSLCDWLDDEVPIDWLADFLKLIHDTPNLDWLLLTKRPENFWKQIPDAFMRIALPANGYGAQVANWLAAWAAWITDEARVEPPANIWLGVSVEDQKRADERIPELLKIPAAIHFLSVEPLLGPVDLTCLCADEAMGVTYNALTGKNWNESPLPTIDWVIVGGESGPNARPCNIEWIRDIISQCKAAGVPCFVKQIGSKPINHANLPANTKHPKGGEPTEWSEDIRVREFPTVCQARNQSPVPSSE